MHPPVVTAAVLAVLATTADLAAQHTAVDTPRRTRSGYELVPRFGGPAATGSQLAEDDAVVATAFDADWVQDLMRPWFGYKAQLFEQYGFAVGGDYDVGYLALDDAPGAEEASGGVARLFGAWHLFGDRGPDAGAVVWRVEHRHRYAATAPDELAASPGYVGSLSTGFDADGLLLTNLYWQQGWLDGDLLAIAGAIEVADYFDTWALASPWTGFQNAVFQAGGGTAPLPEPGAGAAAELWFAERCYLVAGVADRNADASRPDRSFESFVQDAEYFTHLELGWSPQRVGPRVDQLQLALWHGAARRDAGVPDGWGAAITWTQRLGESWLPFVRAGFAEGGGALLQRGVGAGLGMLVPDSRDLLALGVHWGRPEPDVSGPLLDDDQLTLEAFYRLQVSPSFAVTPDLQLLVDPAQSDDDVVLVYGVRGRFAF